MSIKISIIIPNWNGEAFLSRCISAVLQSAAEYGEAFECLLMDDASTDGSGVKASLQFPDVRLISYDLNRGFGHMVNEGARLAAGEILVLVNNDLVARPAFISNLCRHFSSSPQLFGVSGKTVDWENGSPNHVNMRAVYEKGSFNLTWSDDCETTETMFLQGGSCAIRKDLFLEFGGFHPLFAPGYWEDYDMAYQALKAGYQNLYEPQAVGSHLGQGSMIRAHGRDMIEFVRARNKHLLLTMNLTGTKEHGEYWRAMPDYVRKSSDVRFKHRIAILRYLFEHRYAIQSERIKRFNRQNVTDAEIFSRFNRLGILC